MKWRMITFRHACLFSIVNPVYVFDENKTIYQRKIGCSHQKSMRLFAKSEINTIKQFGVSFLRMIYSIYWIWQWNNQKWRLKRGSADVRMDCSKSLMASPSTFTFLSSLSICAGVISFLFFLTSFLKFSNPLTNDLYMYTTPWPLLLTRFDRSRCVPYIAFTFSPDQIPIKYAASW